MTIPQVSKVMIPEFSVISEMIYDTYPYMKIIMVSAVAFYVKDLNFLNMIELINAITIPINNE